jgi:hypothetical protein
MSDTRKLVEEVSINSVSSANLRASLTHERPVRVPENREEVTESLLTLPQRDYTAMNIKPDSEHSDDQE